MTKKLSNSNTGTIPTELLYFKTKFNKVLDERIELGEELYYRQVETQADLKRNKDEYYSWSKYNSELLKKAFNKQQNEYQKIYDDTDSFFFGSIGLRKSPLQDLKSLKDKINHKVNILKQISSKTEFMERNVLKSNLFKNQELETNKTQIFVVAGQDNEARDKTTRFIENLGLEAIVLEDTTLLLEKIKAYPNAKFGIVLYTANPTQDTKSANSNAKQKAQQNKILEHCFLMVKIGKNNVCALVSENVDMPNDISGAVYISMDKSDQWSNSIIKELKKAGYPINMKNYNCA